MQKVCGIYTITSPSGRVYVGQSRHVYRRFAFYRYDKRKGTQPALDRSFFKYGIPAHDFALIHWLPANVEQSRIDYFEQLYMDSFRKQRISLLNTREAGHRGKTSAESKAKFRAARLGHFVSEETRQKIGKASASRRHTAIAKAKVGCFWKGRKRGPLSDEHRAKLKAAKLGKSPWNKGKSGIYSPETIAKIRAARAVQPKPIYTDEMRERMALAAKKRGISDLTRAKINETKKRQSLERRGAAQHA